MDRLTLRVAAITTRQQLEEAGRNVDPATIAEVHQQSVQFSDEILARLRTVLYDDDDDETVPPMEYRVAARHVVALPSPHQRGWEHRKENDERAQVNIPPEHQLAWKKLKNMFKGTPHERAEQFMGYLEEHPGESDEFLQQNADKDVAKWQREQQKQVKQERECEKGQTKYEDAWYKEQERATKEKNNLQQLKERADTVCQACPTCNEDRGDDMIPFAAALRVAARYKSKKKIETQKGDKITVYEYSDRQIANRNRKKAERLEALKKNIGSLRKRVQRDLKSDDPTTMLTALAVGLIDHTYERVGNEDSADEGHFGVTGWTRKHISFGRGKATVRYVGKSGVKHEKKVSDASLVTALKNAYESNDDEDGSIFAHDLGKVDARKVNEYLKQFDVTAKDLRGFHANREMQERLSAIRSKGKALAEDKKAREKQLKTEFLKALEQTAEAVGHEAATLRSMYLVPGLEEDFLADGKVDSKFVKTAGYTYDRRLP